MKICGSLYMFQSIFVHKNPILDHNFAKIRTKFFRHLCFFVGPKMALFVHIAEHLSICFLNTLEKLLHVKMLPYKSLAIFHA